MLDDGPVVVVVRAHIYNPDEGAEVELALADATGVGIRHGRCVKTGWPFVVDNACGAWAWERARRVLLQIVCIQWSVIRGFINHPLLKRLIFRDDNQPDAVTLLR